MMDLGEKAISVWRGASSFRPSRVAGPEVRYVCDAPRRAKVGVGPFCRKAAANVLETGWDLQKDVKIEGTNSLKPFSINKSVKKRSQIKQRLSAKTCRKYTKLPQLRHANGRLSRGTEKLLRAARGRSDGNKKMLNYTERTQLTPLPSIKIP